jgi:excisionase family DNA binding protein
MNLTAPQVAEQMHCTAATVIKHIKQGGLRATKPAKQWLIAEEDLAEWLDENANRAPRRKRRRRAS